MSIVLNEYDWAEKMIANHDLGKKPTETLSRVSKYYYENHYSKRRFGVCSTPSCYSVTLLLHLFIGRICLIRLQRT